MEQEFCLVDERGVGVACDATGLFVGDVPLLERVGVTGPWSPRSAPELNDDLSKRYGLPLDMEPKASGLAAVARALNRGDVPHAQIVALHLRLPAPPDFTKTTRSAVGFADLARRLHASNLLKADWDPAKHPRWPALSPDGVGGRFAPSADGADGSTTDGPKATLIPAQITIPLPLEIPGIPGFPIPSEIGFPPIINPQQLPTNPFPDRPECVEEWEHAYNFCQKLMARRRQGRSSFTGMGRTMSECLLGQVSSDCGGYPVKA